MLLYKYVSAAFWQNLLEDGLIRYSQASAFNDPFELLPVYGNAVVEMHSQDEPDDPKKTSNSKELVTKISGQIDHYVELMNRWNEVFKPPSETVRACFHEAFGDGLYRSFGSSLAILSLSEESDSLLMWAHYADNHRGMVLGFNGAHSFFHQNRYPNENLGSLKRVVYSETRPVVKLSGELDFASTFLVKSREWSYEKEWRMILPIDDAAVSKIVGTEPLYLFTFPPDALVEIAFGAQMPSDVRANITNFFRWDERYGHVALRSTTLDKTRYALSFNRVECKRGFRSRRRKRSNNES